MESPGNPAERVIRRFGGQSALAALLGRRQSTIQHWARTGHIPLGYLNDPDKTAATFPIIDGRRVIERQKGITWVLATGRKWGHEK